MPQTFLRGSQGILDYIAGNQQQQEARPPGVYPLETTGILEDVVYDIGESLAGLRVGDGYSSTYDYETSFPVVEEAETLWDFVVGDPLASMGEALQSYAVGMPLARDPEMGPPQLTGIGQDVAGTLLEFAPLAGPYKRGAERIASNYMDEFMPAEQLGIIIGPKGANKAQRDMLEKAKEMKAEGASADEIFEATKTKTSTGWWLDHPDGVPRAEISDAPMTTMDVFKTDPPSKEVFDDLGGDETATFLRTSISHPQLQDMYPEPFAPEGSHVTIRPYTSAGSYNPVTGDFVLGAPSYRLGDKSLSADRKIAAHELTHMVSGEEGMAKGGSPTMFTQMDEAKDARETIWWSDAIRQYQNRHDVLSPYAAERALIKEYEANDMAEFIPKEGIRDDAKQPMFIYREQYPEDFKNAQDLVNLYGLDKRVEPYSPDQMYHRLADEAQAEMVEGRIDMSVPELQADPFYKNFPVDPDDMILLKQDGSLQIQESTGLSPEDLARRERNRAAKEARRAQGSGYNPDLVEPQDVADYGMQHRPAGKEPGTSLDDLSAIYPDDIYSAKGAEYYGHHGRNNPMDRESIDIIQSMRGNPEGEVTIYRAVPKGVEDINEGDWVTINRDYAIEHGEGPMGGDYEIIQKKVKAKDINTQGDSIHEWGYNPVVAVGASGGLLATLAGEEGNSMTEQGLLGQF